MSTLPTVNLNSLYAAFGSSAAGIDVTSTVNQILDADRATERQWQAQQQLISLQTSALKQMQNTGSSLMDSLDALQDPTGALVASNVTSSQPGIVMATAAPGTAAGTHVVVVQSLATTAAWYSDAVSNDKAAFPTGGYDLTVGLGGSTKTSTIVIGGGVNTPADLAKFINGLSLGVTATLVTDANGVRVAVVADASGSASEFSIQPTPNTSSPALFTRAANGMNASLTVDGVPISSATNTLSSVISGVTLNLNGQALNSEVVLAVGRDTNGAVRAVNNFVSAYNSLVAQINKQYVYDPTNQTSGPLSGDSTIRLLQGSLLASAGYSSSSGVYTTLASLGVTMDDDGSLSANSGKIAAALQNDPESVQSFFQGEALNGFAASVKSSLSLFMDPGQGAFTVDLRSMNSENTDLQNHINDYEDYLSAVRTTLTSKYNAANILLLQLPTLQKQIDALLGNISNGSNGS